MRERKFNILELQEQRKSWATVYEEVFDDNQKKVYLQRRNAVDMYISGHSEKEIEHQTNINQQNISRLIQKCLNINSQTGQAYGYTGLIPYKRTNNKSIINNSSVQNKKRGVFKQLLYEYPSLIKLIEDNYFGTTNVLFEKKISKSNMHRKLLEECRRLKIQDYEYPFNTVDKAQRSLYHYLNKISLEKTAFAMRRESLTARQKYSSTGFGERSRTYPLIPFSTVQIDGHKIDMLYVVPIKNKYGEISYLPAMRMWLIAVIDVSTRAIIGYSLTSNENYNQTDILKALRNSMVPKEPIKFTLRGLSYPENYGYPSLAIKETQWAMINTIMLDNAKSHLANNVIYKICDTLHCSLNYGSVATPETRGIVERVFGTLEEHGYHRLPSTTGSNIYDIRKENAEKNAVKYQITYDDIMELTEYFIALYNTSPHSSLDNQTPLACMERRINAGLIPYKANTRQMDQIYSLTHITQYKRICGSIKGGKRPYITYKGVVYRNEILSQSMGLIGQMLVVEINPDDIRTIRAYFEDGAELGILTAIGEWGTKNHSLKTREDALKLANANKRKNEPFYAPLTELQNELDERALKNRRSRTKAARIRSEQRQEPHSDSELQKKSKNYSFESQPTLTTKIRKTENMDDSKAYTLDELEKIFKTETLDNI